MTARQKCKRYKLQVLKLSLSLKMANETSIWLSEELEKAKKANGDLITEQKRSDKECSMLWRKVEELEKANSELCEKTDKLQCKVDFKNFSISELQNTNTNLRDLLLKERTAKSVMEFEIDKLKQGSLLKKICSKVFNLSEDAEHGKQ